MKINKKTKKIIRDRLLFSLGTILMIRFGTFLPIPGVNHADLAFYMERHSATKNFLNTFSGSSPFVVGLFTLNIFPYINATIIVQILLEWSPELSKLKKEGDFESRRAITRLTRIITLIVTIFQSIGISFYLKKILFDWTYFLAVDITIWLTAGTMIVLWLSELISDYGLGNGASLLVYINIISNLPNLIKKVAAANLVDFNFYSVFTITILSFAALYGIIFLQKGTRPIPLVSSKQLNQPSSQTEVGSYLPLRFNQAGVMPIILTTSILIIPNYIVSLGLFPWLNFLTSFKLFYWIGSFVLILISSSFYSSIVLNPKDIAELFQKMAVTIPGVRPGLQTRFYLKQTIKRVTLIGSTMLATIVILPNFIESILNINGLNELSTTSFLILAGVVLDLIRELDNICYSNAYSDTY